jgi:gliding motility-associated-like protein
MDRKFLIFKTLLCALLFIPGSLFSQIPTKVFEITSILVDGCDGGNEGKNEMVIFQIGPSPVNVNDLRVDGAGATGVIDTAVWPNTNNPWLKIATPPAKPTEVAQINATITNCGYLKEPIGGILPAGKKVLLITSTDFNPAAHSFITLGDTLYVIFQISGNTNGHFVNYGTPSSLRTLVLHHRLTAGADTIVYDRSLLINQAGNPGAQDGASVMYTFSGVATYTNPGCQAPYIPLSAAWTIPASLCQSSSPLDLNTLITGSTGGTWSGTGVSGNMFNPSGLSGNISVTYTVGSSPCTTTVTHNIQVLVTADASWTAPASLCQSASPVNLSALVTGTTGGTWSGTGVTGSTFNPAGLSGNISITYNVGTSPCNDSETHIIQVVLSADASWTNPGTICETASPVNLSTMITGDIGGTWSGTGITNASTGLFDPSVAGAGTFQIIYTISGACGDADTAFITVTSLADATIYPAGPFCSSDAPVLLSTVDPGGTWLGTGITNSSTGQFSPSVAGAGSFDIIYSIAGSCGNSDTLTIIVNQTANAAINPSGPYCITATVVNLSANDPGGIWSGTGITNPSTGLFDPSVAGVGIYEIIYTISGTCGDADTTYITVAGIADATINPTGPYCSNDAPVILNAADPSGVWSGTGITNITSGQFSPSVAGSGTYDIIYTIGGSCGDADTTSIMVMQAPAVTVGGTAETCEAAADGTATATPNNTANGYTYMWDNLQTDSTITGLAAGQYSVTVTDTTNGCWIKQTVQVDASSVSCEFIPPVIYVPNVFSPNDDGNNDVLFVHGQGINSLSFIIYDRWGEKVFTTTDTNSGWDGTFHGKLMETAVFMYSLKAEMNDGTTVKRKGSISLMR